MHDRHARAASACAIIVLYSRNGPGPAEPSPGTQGPIPLSLREKYTSGKRAWSVLECAAAARRVGFWRFSALHADARDAIVWNFRTQVVAVAFGTALKKSFEIARGGVGIEEA